VRSRPSARGRYDVDHPLATGQDRGLYTALTRQGVSRRSFLRFTAAMAAVLALPSTYAPRIARAVTTAPRLPVVWLRGQDCAGDTMAFLRAADPTVGQMLLQLLSVEYHETLMASAGQDATEARLAAMEEFADGYIAVVEGSIPTADDGASCTVGGRSFQEIARDVCSGALATIAVGSCACDGGAPAAGGGSTGAVGVAAVVDGGTLIRLPGCPINVDYLTATLVHYLTFGSWPDTDGMQRPYFAYGSLIHNQCERRPHYEYGEFVLTWGDEGAQKGWCLYKMGCKGPETFGECPTARYASGTSWPVRAGHGCIGCHSPGFWDAMSPFYRRLAGPLPFAPQVTIDQIGALLVGGVVAGTAAHGAASYVRQRRSGGHDQPAAAVATAPGPGETGPGETGPEPGIERGPAPTEEPGPRPNPTGPAEAPAAVDGSDEPGASA
jgi:hydrogenase small subunit